MTTNKVRVFCAIFVTIFFSVLGMTSSYGQERIVQALWRFGTGGVILEIKVIPDINGDGKQDVLVGSAENNAYLLDGVTGKKLWNHPTSGGVVSIICLSDVSGDGKPDMVAGAGNILYWINGVTGTTMRYQSLGDDIRFVLAITDISGDNKIDIVAGVKGSYHYNIFGINGLTGDVIWKYTKDYSGWQSMQNLYGVIIDDISGDNTPDVVIGEGWWVYGYVTAIDGKSGNEIWSSTALGDQHRLTYLAYTPDISGDDKSDVIALDRLGYAHLISGLSGKEVWSYYSASIVPIDDNSYPATYISDVTSDGRPETIVGGNDGVIALDGLTGNLLWKCPSGQVLSIVRAPDLSNDGMSEVIAGAGDKYVYLINGATGLKIWTYLTAGSVRAVTHIDDVSGDGTPDALVGSDDRFVYCISGKAEMKSSLTISLSALEISPEQSISVTGFILPAQKDIAVTITYFRPDGTTLSKSVKTALDGSYRDTIMPDQVGKWTVKASWEGNEDYFGAQSDVLEFTVEGYFLTLQGPFPNVTIKVNEIIYQTDKNGKVEIGAPKDSTILLEAEPILSVEDRVTRFAFLQWSDGIKDNPRTVSLNENMTLSLIYKTQYLVSVDISEHTVLLTASIDNREYLATRLPVGLWFDEGSTHTIRVPTQIISGGTRYDFVGWNDQTTSPTRDLSVQGPVQYTAYFNALYQLIVKTAPEDVAAIAVNGTGWYASGSNVQVTSRDVIVGPAGTRWVFQGFEGYPKAERSITVAMDAPKTIIAGYETEFYLKVDTNPRGILSVPGTGWYKSDAKLTSGPLPAKVKADQYEYAFQGWLVDSTPISEESVTITMDKPHDVLAVFYRSEVLEFPVGTELKKISVLTNSSIRSASRFEDRFSITLEGDLGTSGTLSILLPTELLQQYNSSVERIAVLLDGEEVKPVIAAKEGYIEITLNYAHSTHTVDIYYNSVTVVIKVVSLFNLPIQGTSINLLWADGSVFKTESTDASGEAVIHLPVTTYMLQTSYWWQMDTRQLLLKNDQVIETRFLFYWDLITMLITTTTSLGIVTFIRKRSLVKAGKIDPLVIQVAEKHKRPLSASLLTRELNLSLEESRKALQRFVKNKQGKVYTDIDGTEYIGIPSVWKDLSGAENALLNRLLELGGRSRRVELRVWLGLSEMAFSELMAGLERNGYVTYDQVTDEYRLRGIS